MTLIGKVSPFAAITLLLLACSAGGKDEPLSPGMEQSLDALAHLPVTIRNTPPADVNGIDGGTGSTSGSNETQFGETDTGKNILTGLRSNGATGNGPGNGGVGTGIGPGGGGVGSGYGPGGGSAGVGSSTGAGGGGVASGLVGAGDLASSVCDFLDAFCASLTKCEGSKVDMDSCALPQHECVTLVNPAIAQGKTTATIPPGAIAGLRCVSNALRSSGCLISESGAKSFESRVRGCGLPASFGQDDEDSEVVTPDDGQEAYSPDAGL